jgi:hypothetical protein
MRYVIGFALLPVAGFLLALGGYIGVAVAEVVALRVLMGVMLRGML